MFAEMSTRGEEAAALVCGTASAEVDGAEDSVA